MIWGGVERESRAGSKKLKLLYCSKVDRCTREIMLLPLNCYYDPNLNRDEIVLSLSRKIFLFDCGVTQRHCQNDNMITAIWSFLHISHHWLFLKPNQEIWNENKWYQYSQSINFNTSIMLKVIFKNQYRFFVNLEQSYSLLKWIQVIEGIRLSSNDWWIITWLWDFNLFYS